jgi:hypothetical protein
VLTDLLRRWRGGFPASPVAPPLRDGDPDSVLVDPRTQTFWSRSTGTSTTLVEASGPAAEVESVGRRVAALLAAQDAPAPPSGARDAGTAPGAGPAGCEGHFVDLLREGRFEGAFALLAAPCQARWGSARAFAADHGASAQNLLGLSVREVRYLAEWVDDEGGCLHHDVAELDVDYRVRLSASRAATVSRTVHLVAAPDGWRSICYPPPPAAR